ncbi:hypothetical protein DB35_00445 [Streptomyces abyssalis]|uniref:Uncharacterized protein n=1 Tax=Streptomyces abyssalis TaxID=933944 RepID=A0A1E7JVI3_9ACTN|nr:hypothetical protein AN215_00415 [Streptomyces abyssalis]OEU95833.1 hypothetical protein DB35_00445 [Streptomyces abyssalis]
MPSRVPSQRVPAHLVAPPGRAEELAGVGVVCAGSRSLRGVGGVVLRSGLVEAEGSWGEDELWGEAVRAGICAPAGTSESSCEEVLGSGWSIRGGWSPTGS